MSSLSLSDSEAVQRLSRRDPALRYISLTGRMRTDSGLADCLLAHPDVVTEVYLGGNQLTDETGVKLARYLAASTTVKRLNLSHNQFGPVTYLAVAAALRGNSSLQVLYLHDNQAEERTHIDAAFVEALRVNPERPVESSWYLYSFSDEYKRLNEAARQLGHPTLQTLLVARLASEVRSASLRSAPTL